MKKKILIIGGVFATIVVVVLILLLNRTKYTIKVSMIDDNSPDRILTVYDNNGEKVEVKRIEYENGTVLCNGYNTAVHYGDIENRNKLVVVLKDKTKVKAKIVLDEVK